MPVPNMPVHKQCHEHPRKCQSIENNQEAIRLAAKDREKLWEHMGMRPKIRTVIVVFVSSVGLFGSLFATSIGMSKFSADRMIAQAQTTQQKVSEYAKESQKIYHDMSLDVKELQVRLEQQIQESKKLVEEMKKQNNRPSPGG